MEFGDFLIYSVHLKVLHETLRLWKRRPWLRITVGKKKNKPTVQVSSESQLQVKSPVHKTNQFNYFKYFIVVI